MKNWKIKITALLTAVGLNSNVNLKAQSKNMITETFKVSGNCGMCKKTIETAASKKANKAEWSEEKKELKITYDINKTNAEEILKSIAYAGYDNEKYFAPQTAYSKLPECCRYERSEKAYSAGKITEHNSTSSSIILQTENSTIESIYTLYFSIKDALVKTDAISASLKAKDLLREISSIKLETLDETQRKIFMKYLAPIKSDAGKIGESTDAGQQRVHLKYLSQNIYEMIKEIKPSYPVYLNHCPMFNDGKGADWLSKEKVIKNPYYGSYMLSCGKISETIH